jgi:signal transduction histidine kinase
MRGERPCAKLYSVPDLLPKTDSGGVESTDKPDPIRIRRSISRAKANRWLALFVVTRLAATAVAAALLGAREVTDHDGLLITLGVAYCGVSVLGTVRWSQFQRLPAVWALDGVIALLLVLATEQWRSPFYLVAITSLVLPATALPFKRALAWGIGFTAAYFAVALTAGIDWQTLETSGRLESFATHFMVPMLVVLALAYSAGLLRRLEEERNRSEELALEAERRRIALDLHDSAKQRIHAAHLVLSSLARSSSGNATIEHAMRELRAAATDLDANLSELRTPLASRHLKFALRERAAELEKAAGSPVIEVTGEAPELPSFLGAHTFHIVSEAMTNAARHAGAQQIRVQLSHSERVVRVVVSDDGLGMPRPPTSSDHGIRSMMERAELLDGTLTISATNEDMRGTTVRLEIPLSD